MITRFVLLRSPLRILTADLGLFKRLARNSQRASLARFSSAGARRRIFSTPSTTPEISSRLARGWTRTVKVTVLLARSCAISRCDGRFSMLVPIANRRREMVPESLDRLASAKKGCANTDFRGTFRDGRFEIVRHAHREHGQLMTQLRLQRVSQFAQPGEIRAHRLDVFEIRRGAHSPREAENVALQEAL